VTANYEQLVEQVTARTHRAMKEARVSKADKKHSDLVAANLHRLLVDVLLEGRLKTSVAQDYLDKLRQMLVERTATIDVVKNGIVAFDEVTQYIAATTNAIEYPTDNNRARDLLVTYARALHR
jgi:hypothetical protein